MKTLVLALGLITGISVLAVGQTLVAPSSRMPAKMASRMSRKHGKMAGHRRMATRHKRAKHHKMAKHHEMPMPGMSEPGMARKPGGKTHAITADVRRSSPPR